MKILTSRRQSFQCTCGRFVLQFLSFGDEKGHRQRSNETARRLLPTETYIQVLLLTIFFDNLSLGPLRDRIFLTARQLPDMVPEPSRAAVSELPDDSLGDMLIDEMEPVEPKLVLGRGPGRSGRSSRTIPRP